MARRIARVVGIGLLSVGLLGVAGCGGSDDDADDQATVTVGDGAGSGDEGKGDDAGSPPQTGESGEIELPVACTLLNAADVSEAAGIEVLEGKDRGAPTGCLWRTPNKDSTIGDDVLLIELEGSEYYEGTVVTSMKDRFTRKRSSTPEATDVAGVGDGAFAFTQGQQVTLYAVQGDILLTLIFGETLTDLELSRDIEEIAVDLAKLAVAELPD